MVAGSDISSSIAVLVLFLKKSVGCRIFDHLGGFEKKKKKKLFEAQKNDAVLSLPKDAANAPSTMKHHLLKSFFAAHRRAVCTSILFNIQFSNLFVLKFLIYF